jgi:hypothetical protein
MNTTPLIRLRDRKTGPKIKEWPLKLLNLSKIILNFKKYKDILTEIKEFLEKATTTI